MENNCLLLCEIDNIMLVYNMLNAMYINDSTINIVFNVDETGIHFVTIDKSQSVYSKAHLMAESFSFYKSQPTKIVLNYRYLLQTFKLLNLSKNTLGTFKMSFKDNTLFLLQEEQDILNECKIYTIIDYNDILDYGMEFREKPIKLKLIIKSAIIREALQELSDLDISALKFIYNEEIHGIALEGDGLFGKCQVLIPIQNENIKHFEASEPIDISYKFENISINLKSLQISTEVFIRINQNNLLCIQHMVEDTKCVKNFIEFYIFPISL